VLVWAVILKKAFRTLQEKTLILTEAEGNDTVDVRGKYTEITWSSAAGDVSQDGLPHEMLGYGDANTETRYGNVMFSAYMNEASAAAAIVIIKIGNRVTPV
jgi:hypothetical protein